MNIVFPMCGLGSRVKERFNMPKPFIDIDGKTLIEQCIDGIGLDGNYIFITRRFTEFENCEELYSKTIKLFSKYTSLDNIIVVDHHTTGAVSTILLAKDIINTKEQLLISNCDQIWNLDAEKLLTLTSEESLDGFVSTWKFPDISINETSPYSFAKLNERGYVSEIKEKFAISEHSMNGLFYWAHGSDFVECANKLMKSGNDLNGEFYVSETYNYAINSGMKIKILPMSDEEYISLGTTEEILKYYSKSETLS